MSVVAFIKRLREKGWTWDQAMEAAEAFEAEAPALERDITPRQERNRRYYENKRLKASESKTPKTDQDVSDAFKTPRAPPRTQVVDTSLPSLRSEEVAVAAAETREPDPKIDDWPSGSASDIAKRLIAEIGSPWLDPCKSLDLNTTLGRFSAWKRLGASWEFDVVPTVTKLCQKNRKLVKSWKFFDDAIAQSTADNQAALAMPEARGVRATGPPSITAQIAAERREAERRAFEMMDREDGRKN